MKNDKVVLDKFDINMLHYRIKQHGGDAKLVMEDVIKNLDATFTCPDGSRPRQTNSYVWKRTDAEFFWLIDYLADNGMTNEEYKDYISRRAAMIDKSLKYEEENPPIDYIKVSKAKAKKTVKKAIAKEKDMFSGEVKDVDIKTGKVKRKTAKDIRQDRIAKTATFNIFKAK